MSSLAFRNVDASPDDPVSEWPLEAIQTVIERGDLSHWRRLGDAVQAEPWGNVARGIEEVLTYSRPYGVAEAMERVIARARKAAEEEERRTIAAEINRAIRDSGLSRTQFASRVGTSASRLSTYATGKVTPSATLLLRMLRLARRAGAIDHEFPGESTDRAAAASRLLAMPPPGEGPEPDWEDQKRDMLDARMRKLEGA